MSQVANENPLDGGNDANSVESAAEGFTRMLNDEAPAPRRSETGKARSRSSEPEEEEDDEKSSNRREVPDTDTDDDGQGPDADEFLTEGDEPENEEDENGEDDDEDDKSDDGDDGEDDDDEIDWDREVEIEVAGETKSLKLSEIAAGYQRDADYRQKTTALANERREVEEYAAEAVAERKLYAETLDGWVDMTAALEPSAADWDALKRTNPALYVETKEQWDGIRKKVDEAKAERAKITEREQVEAQRQYAAHVRAENQKLAEKVPALANPKKAAQFRDLIFAYGKRAGYEEQELAAGAVDHRDVLTLYKAARYDEMMQSRKAGQRPAKGGKKAPQHSVSSQPRQLGKRQGSNSRAQRDADRKLARSGSQDDAAMAFTRLIGG